MPLEYPDDMSVLVSDIVRWEAEFRCFILDRTLMTYSIYARQGELQNSDSSTQAEQAGLLLFIEQLLADSRVDLLQATVVDVGLIAGAGWAVVEQNAAWGAGIYGCDPEKVLKVIEHASVPSP